MIDYQIKLITDFNLMDLNKQYGRLIVQEPTDSDLQEGSVTTQLMFATFEGEPKVYLLAEWLKGEVE